MDRQYRTHKRHSRTCAILEPKGSKAVIKMLAEETLKIPKGTLSILIIILNKFTIEHLNRRRKKYYIMLRPALYIQPSPQKYSEEKRDRGFVSHYTIGILE